MKYYIIAGEASGDLHASNLMRQIKKNDNMAHFRYWGGDLMAAEGGQLVAHYRDTAYMGVFEVVKNLFNIFRNFRKCEKDILNYQPDVVILVDYPGFNLRMAKFIKRSGFKVFYYIAPKVWAWNRSRVKKIRKYVDRVYSILPFESDFFAKYGINAIYSGNPLLDSIDQRKHKIETGEEFRHRNGLTNKPIIAMLAGSRKEEVHRLLPEMVKMMPHFPDFQFVIAGAPSFTMSHYEPYLQNVKEARVLFDETYSLLQHAHAAMVTSGTATLEAALLNCPQVVCYKMWGGAFTDFMSKRVIIKVPYISLVNLIMQREVIKELFQSTFSTEALLDELKKLCYDESHRNKVFKGYEELSFIMGGPGSSERTARLMADALSE
ncbi:lipid-A-disaccharide synthase [Natronoflexus pectinivorans]|uniref:Lipid-A-disaccharide synthase n=1 Tax=Natronoflexus pectinivorans TaxID=682526 RepID=A0A4V2RW98_9BACT|nr:lipid-A-disaccharide synthase [Natronoflexus pectinivorans]TCO07322.1 lipid-A-disaccharide synthase [Natronoflexus pectinivorans]